MEPTIYFFWWILSGVELVRMRLLSFIQNLLSITPMLHCHELSVSTPPRREQLSSEDDSNSDEDEINDPDFRGAAEERNPYYPNQIELNDLTRDLALTKSNAELLPSRLKQWNFFR